MHSFGLLCLGVARFVPLLSSGSPRGSGVRVWACASPEAPRRGRRRQRQGAGCRRWTPAIHQTNRRRTFTT
eukprot:9176732-Prorocentrum_lima.AAC.1